MDSSPQLDGACNNICRRTIGKIAVITVDRRHGLHHPVFSRAGLTKLQPVGTT